MLPVMVLRRAKRTPLAPAALVAAAVAALPTSCTSIVLQDAAAPAVCRSDDDCGSATACVDGSCSAVDADPLPREATTIGPDGGIVDGPDGIVLDIPAGALASSTSLAITTTTATYEYANFTPTGRFYSIEPVVTFAAAAPARLEIPDVAGDGQAVSLFLRPVPPTPTWDAIGADDDGGAFVVSRTGTFGVGVAHAEAP